MTYSLVLCIVSILAGFFGVLWAFEKKKFGPDLNAATLFTGYWSAAGGLLLVLVIVQLQSAGVKEPHWLQIQAVLFALAGAASGAILGTLISPQGDREASVFSQYAKTWAALGVGSGITLKVLYDHSKDHLRFIRGHWLQEMMFVIAALLTLAATYNARAYDRSLFVRIRKDEHYDKAFEADPVPIPAGSSVTFYAETCGPSDSFSDWQVFPPSLGTFAAKTGMFTAAATIPAGTAEGKVTAVNLEDPTLSNFRKIKIVTGGQNPPPPPPNPAPAPQPASAQPAPAQPGADG